MTSPARSRVQNVRSISTVLRLVAAAGLLVDARIHLKLAPVYDAIRSSTVSQGDLFRVEGWLAVVAAVLVLVPRSRITALIALGVAGGGLVPLLVYRYVDVGAIGPLPPMYEPVWYSDKTLTGIAQALAALAAATVLVILVLRSRRAGLGR